MKIQLETISNSDRSFSLIYNPRLSDLFYWHFHPEYELVFIECTSGPRHVGEHVSSYEGSDLVLIGSNIPHLNFDYGVKSEYRKAVLHLKKEFVETHFNGIPELSSLKNMFDKSTFGLAFSGKLKLRVGQRLFDLEKLTPFQQYGEILEILHMLAQASEMEELHDHAYKNKFSLRDQDRLRNIYSFVDKNFHRKIELNEVAEISNLSKEAFCRYFKKGSSYTFIEFLNRYRISQAKHFMMSGMSVSDACYQSGFESLSYFNRTFNKVAKENPRAFRKRYV